MVNNKKYLRPPKDIEKIKGLYQINQFFIKHRDRLRIVSKQAMRTALYRNPEFLRTIDGRLFLTDEGKKFLLKEYGSKIKGK